MGILSKILIGWGAFATAGTSIAFVTTYMDASASNESVAKVGVVLCLGIASLIGGLILREHQKPKAVQTA